MLSVGGERSVNGAERDRYCNEFSHRFNRRGEQLAMFDGTLKNLTRGEALPYRVLVSNTK